MPRRSSFAAIGAVVSGTSAGLVSTLGEVAGVIGSGLVTAVETAGFAFRNLPDLVDVAEQGEAEGTLGAAESEDVVDAAEALLSQLPPDEAEPPPPSEPEPEPAPASSGGSGSGGASSAS